MLVIRRQSALANAPEQKKTVAGVNQGVDALGKHGRATREISGYELGNSNCAVAGHRGKNDCFGPGRH